MGGLDPKPIEILAQLSEILLRSSDRTQALLRVTQICRQAMHSHACALTLVDLDKRELCQVALASEGEEFEVFTASSDPGGNNPRQSDKHEGFDLIAGGGVIEKYDLQVDTQGVVSPDVARRNNLNSLLSLPLKFEGRTIGYISHFSSKSERFSADEKSLLDIFSRQAVVIIEKIDYQSLHERSIGIFNNLVQNLLLLSPGDFLETVAAEAMKLLSVPVCIVWKLNERDEILKIAATAGGVDTEYRKTKLKLSEAGFERSSSHRGVAYIPDVTKEPKHYLYPAEAYQRGWVSLLSAPMRVKGRLIGMVDVYTKELRYFRKWERDFFGAFAHHAALSLEKAELLRKTEETDNDQKKLVKLTDIMLQMTAASTVEELLKQFFEAGLELVDAERGWISLLDDKVGELIIVAPSQNIPGKRRLSLGKGLTGKALLAEEPVRADDVTASEWRGSYEKFWEDTRSEMAIPMLIRRAPVRVGSEVELATKPIGVLNIESPTPYVFSKMDEDCLLSLAYQAAVIIDNLENERKRTQLRKIEQKIVGERDYEQIIQTLLRGITNTLGFEYVIISWINWEQNCIRTEYVKGLASKNELDKFKEMATYSLASNSIHAHVAKQGGIVVPDPADERLNSAAYKKFGLDRMLTVFVPMTGSTDNRPIGIVEAGYRKTHRKHIYERDVQILQSFVDYVVQAFEQKRSGMLDKVSHEFMAPIAGIRNNASFLKMRIDELPPEFADSKFDDILTDCEILLNQVGELEYILGRSSRVSEVKRTLVYRDVIIKTVNQLKPLIKEQGFDPSKVSYNPADSGRIRLYVDKAKLNQVVYNLVTNSIKYAERDPEQFAVRLEVEETNEAFIIKFQDWGIGINQELEEKIFEEGFRTPEAQRMNVSGSGLGLTIARKIMKAMGGSLKLTNNFKPTEFKLTLPKKMSEVPQ